MTLPDTDFGFEVVGDPLTTDLLRSAMADMLASSRNTRTARSRYHGLANRSSAVCSAPASAADSSRE